MALYSKFVKLLNTWTTSFSRSMGLFAFIPLDGSIYTNNQLSILEVSKQTCYTIICMLNGFTKRKLPTLYFLTVHSWLSCFIRNISEQRYTTLGLYAVVLKYIYLYTPVFVCVLHLKLYINIKKLVPSTSWEVIEFFNNRQWSVYTHAQVFSVIFLGLLILLIPKNYLDSLPQSLFQK